MGGSGAGTHRILRFVSFSAVGKLRAVEFDFLFRMTIFPCFHAPTYASPADLFRAFRKTMGCHPSSCCCFKTGAQTVPRIQESGLPGWGHMVKVSQFTAHGSLFTDKPRVRPDSGGGPPDLHRPCMRLRERVPLRRSLRKAVRPQLLWPGAPRGCPTHCRRR